MRSLVEDSAQSTGITLVERRRSWCCVTGVKNTHDNGTTSVSSRVLSQVVAARELLSALVALERLVLRVQRTIVTLEVLLATEATRAESADEGLRGVLSEGLLATATCNRHMGSRGVRRAGSRSLSLGLVLLLGRLLAGRCFSAVAPAGDAGLALDNGSNAVGVAVREGLLDRLARGHTLLDPHVSSGVFRVGQQQIRGCERQARLAEGLVLVLECMLAEEFFLLKGGIGSNALSLAAQVVGVSKVDEAVELVVRVQVREAIEGRETGEGLLSRVGEGRLCTAVGGQRSRKTSENQLVLLVIT